MSKIQDIENRWSEATPGPWQISLKNGCRIGSISRRPGDTETYHLVPVDSLPWQTIMRDARCDAEAIANAPSDVAYLLAEVKRLKDGIKHLQNFVCMCHEMHPDQCRCSTCIQADEILREAAQ